MEIYNKFDSLCAKIGKSPSAVAIELGIAKSTVSGWKSGRNGATNATLKKIADYFGVTVDYLLGNEEKEKTPPVPMTGKEESIQRAIDAMTGLTAEQIDMIVRIAKEMGKKI